jgi:paraquat-inducible protein B
MEIAAEPVAKVKSRADRRFNLSLIWLIPVVTVLVGLWLAWDTFSKRGPTITISFETAEGLVAGQSHVKRKDVDLGIVKTVELNADMSHVLVTVQMNHGTDAVLTDKASFWVVKPRLFAGNISGLSTLISGSYIELLPSREAGKSERHFTGLENPPVLQTDVPGHVFLLKGSRIGSINLGSPIFFRDMDVGEVLGWDLGDMAESVTIHAFVRAPFDTYVHDETRFWDASGLSVKLGAEGVQLQLESLRAILLGGIAFETPGTARTSKPSAENQTFDLYADKNAADNASFRRRISLLGYFDGSVSGLGPGSPVTFRGLRIGQVVSVNLQYDAKTDAIRTPVRFEVEPERIADVHLAEGRGPVANLRTMVERGMRAQLQSVNLLTGQMGVSFDFFPDAAPAQIQTDGDVIIVPTQPGQLADLTHQVGDLLAKINALPFTEIGENLNQTLAGLSATANGPELKRTLQSLDATIGTAQTLMTQLSAGATPALKRLPDIAAALQDTVTRANKLVGSADAGYGDNSRFKRSLDQLLSQLTDTARSLRILSDLLVRHPEALIRGRTDGAPE